MKKTTVFVIAFLLASASTFASGLLIRGTYFTPSDSDFKSIYGSGWIYGGEIGFKVWNGLDLFLEGGYFSAKGKLTYTEEDTTLTLIPAGGGVKYYFMNGKLRPYIAAGVRYYMYQESNPIGNVKKNGLGYLGRAGVSFEFGGGFRIDVCAGYSLCKITPTDFEINLGGLELSAGIFFGL